jgi:hypothetical protein
MFSELQKVFGMITTFPPYQVLFLISNSPFPKDSFDLVCWFFYSGVDIPDVFLKHGAWRSGFQKGYVEDWVHGNAFRELQLVADWSLFPANPDWSEFDCIQFLAWFLGFGVSS